MRFRLPLRTPASAGAGDTLRENGAARPSVAAKSRSTLVWRARPSHVDAPRGNFVSFPGEGDPAFRYAGLGRPMGRASILADGAIRRSCMRALARRPGGLAAAMLATSCLVSVSAHAQDATWGAAPPTNNWNSAANWSPATVPTRTASFGASNTTALTFSAAATIGTIQFNAGAPAYSFALTGKTLNVQGIGAGGGIVNNSANAPAFTLAFGGALNFSNSASAGNAQINNVNLLFGAVNFNNNSTAGTATLTNNGGGLVVTFRDSSTGGNANMFITGELGNPVVQTQFLDTSTDRKS